MDTVQHGRRAGQMKGMAPPGYSSHSAPAAGDRLPELTMNDVRQMTILSRADWERIQSQLNRRKIEEERVQKAREEKERLKEMSKQQIKNWTNTIVGQRQKKLEGRTIREAKEEEERKIIDIEEARYQSKKRKEAIERAKTQQYYQTDRVKGFHGALLLTEVLKEREAQLELKRLKEAALAGQDKDWLDKAQREYEESILRDQEEAQKRMERMKHTAKFQKAQVMEINKAMDREQKDDTLEGEELKRLAAQYEQECKRLNEIRLQEAKQLMSDNVRQISDVERMRDIQQQQEEEEDEECRIFAAAKRKMMKLRAEKERQLHNEKQSRLEKIRNKLNAQLQQKLDDEDDRIRRAVEENDQKLASEEAVKETKIKKAQKEMHEHRIHQLKEQEQKEREERKKELEMLAVRKQADLVFQLNESEKQRRMKDDKKTLQSFHIRQIGELGERTEKSREQQLAQDHKNQELLALEEQQFQEYAGKVIAHCERGGRNVYPLVKAAREGAGGGQGPVFPGKGGVRPSYMVADQSGVQMPNYQRGTTDEVKENIYGKGQSGKRLGFVW